jgi:uncharacterized membrane protein YcaP (DUF421 family)
MFFSDWEAMLRVLLVGIFAYAAMTIALRVAGERTLSKMNAFDFIVTVALGSVLATVIVSKDVALLEGVLAMALLVGLQFVITWLSVRSRTVRRGVKGSPKLMLLKGEMLRDAMKDARVTESEILAAIRSEGVGSVSSVGAVVLETNGKLSVVKNIELDEAEVLRDVEGYNGKR